jgi:hypothetical protein
VERRSSFAAPQYPAATENYATLQGPVAVALGAVDLDCNPGIEAPLTTLAPGWSMYFVRCHPQTTRR